MDIVLLREADEGSVDLEIVERDLEEEGPDEGIFCRFCGRLLASTADAIKVSGHHHHTFFNPAGIVFEIRCFRQAGGCTHLDESSTEFTWFAGYSWSLALCRGCSSHMGWYFSSVDSSFYGLIAANLAR